MPGKVLLADDSLSIQKSLTQLLKDAGIEVVTVGNGEHAVRRLAAIKPDLVLADVFMPVRDGFEVCEYIKNSQDFSHVPVLLLSSAMEPYDEKKARRVGADGRLAKPFTDPGATLATIKQWLGKATQAKPAAAAHAPPIEEFAVAVPAAEAAPEPAPEQFSTRPAAVTFDQQAAPMGFTDLLESAPAAPAAAVSEPPPPPTELSATLPSEPVGVESPAAMVPEAEPEPEAAAPPAPALTASLDWQAAAPAELAPPPITLPPEPSPAPESQPGRAVGIEEAPRKSEYKVEKPELASPWEMTGPPPGAPEIPSGPAWDSQWKGVEETEAAPTEAPPPDRFEPGEFAAAMTAAQGGAVAEAAPPGETPPPDRFEPAEFTAAMTATPGAGPAGVDPALVEAVVREVMQRLSPQVMAQITREIVRPLAEALLKQKLNSE